MASPSPAEQREFPAFPFDPYPIQLQLMRAVYSALQKGGVAIVESPTGTGKTLSLICSVLQWLQDQKRDQCCNHGAASSGEPCDDEPDWMRDFAPGTAHSPPKHHVAKLKSTSSGSSIRMFKDGKKLKFSQDLGAMKTTRDVFSTATNDVDEFLLEDYESDEELNIDVKEKHKSAEDLAYPSTDECSEDEVEVEKPVKVFFCSRTHSQLSQFVGELQRTPFSTSLKTVPVGSRKSFCINPEVMKLKHSFRINERCLELQKERDTKSSQKKVHVIGRKKAKKKAGGCPFMSKKSQQRVFREFLHESMVMDIEDMVRLGESLGTCPYYASRSMVPMADLVILPYQSILHRPTREATRLKLNRCVVIIDEAHNLVDSISSMYSCQLSELQLHRVRLLLTKYLDKFRSRLGAANRRYIQTLLLLIDALSNRIARSTAVSGGCSHDDLTSDANKCQKKGDILTINDFLFSLNIDNVNMFKLWRYMKESKIVHKVSGYADQISYINDSNQCVKEEPGKVAPVVGSTITSFHSLAELILAMMNADSDGRVLVVPRSSHDDNDRDLGGGYIKFLMLNAAQIFMEVIDQAHAVILAGGTLQPVEELRYRLFPNLHENRIHTFACGHIVPAENVLALAVARGPTGRTFDFTYHLRSLPETMDELGRLIFNLCCIVPEGMVIFLPSFEYEQQLFLAWNCTGMWDKLQTKKAMFREPRDAASVEHILREYNDVIVGRDSSSSRKTGAVLLCIVGGKMSEGINFNDGLGRCVVMVGLPYPSPSDPELMERMRFIDQLAISPSKALANSKLPALLSAGYCGRDYYENLCMKAVNQSIGRAIRHIKDYASILLVDARYTTSSVPSRQASKLPNWIRERLVNMTGNFGEVQKLLYQFFKAKAAKDTAALDCQQDKQ